MKRCVPLEPAAEEVCQANSKPPLIFELPPAEGRMVLEKAQDTPVYKYPARVGKVRVNTGRWGTIPVWLGGPGGCCPPGQVVWPQPAGQCDLLYPRRRLGVRKLPHP